MKEMKWGECFFVKNGKWGVFLLKSGPSVNIGRTRKYRRDRENGASTC